MSNCATYINVVIGFSKISGVVMASSTCCFELTSYYLRLVI